MTVHARTTCPDGGAVSPGSLIEGMVRVPDGTFLMGSDDFYPDERPAHEREVVERDRLVGVLDQEACGTDDRQVHPPTPPRPPRHLGVGGVAPEVADLAVVAVEVEQLDVAGRAAVGAGAVEVADQLVPVGADPDVRGHPVRVGQVLPVPVVDVLLRVLGRLPRQ